MLAGTYFAADALVMLAYPLRPDGTAAKTALDIRAILVQAPVLAGLFLALRLDSLRSGEDLPLYCRAAMELSVVVLWLQCVLAGFQHAAITKAEAWPLGTRPLLVVIGTSCWLVSLYGGWPELGGARFLCAILASVSLLIGFLHDLRFKYVRLLGVVRHTLSPASMAVVVLLAVELQLEGLGEREPSRAVRTSMTVLAGALLGAAGLIFCAPLLGVVGSDGSLVLGQQQRAAATALQVVGCGCTIAMLGAFGHLAAALAALPKSPRSLCATLLCLLVLCVLFLAVYVCLFARVIAQSGPKPPWLAAAERGAEPAPMLGALLVAARCRALALGGEGPPGWSQDAMVVATAGVALATVAARVRWLGILALALQYVGVVAVLGGVATMTKATATGKGAFIHGLLNSLSR